MQVNGRIKSYNVIIDTDPGLGKPFAEVDDGFAIFIVLNSPDIFNLLGITICYGNVPMKTGYRLAKKYLKIAQKEKIPVLRGALNKNQLKDRIEASDFIIKQANEYPGDLTILVLGPQTNIANAFLKDNELEDKIKELVVMGGVFQAPVLKFSPITRHIDERFFDKLNKNYLVAEFNIMNDPIAASIVLSRNIPTRIFPLNVTTKTGINKKHLRLMREANTRISHFCYKNVLYWYILNNIITKGNGFYPHDTFVPIYKINPTIFKFKKLGLKVDIRKIPGKIEIINRKGKNIPSKFIKYVCFDFLTEEFHKIFLDRLLI
ncbi:MAG: nucleoside hydrolase [Candidatus Helarchaeota archaeon]